jgi:hypothetical protein
MDLTGRFVRLWLSPTGKEALSEVIPGGVDFEALVVEEDSNGLWLWIPTAGHESREVTLLKWEYFAAASLEYQPNVPQEKSPAGFKRPG